MNRPRPSSPTDPAEWRVTEDGYPFEEGDRLFNYYDLKWGIVGAIDPRDGWFRFEQEDGTRCQMNCSRVSKFEPKRVKW